MINNWHLIKDESIISYLLTKEQPYWTIYPYEGKVYIMTFEYNLYEVQL